MLLFILVSIERLTQFSRDMLCKKERNTHTLFLVPIQLP